MTETASESVSESVSGSESQIRVGKRDGIRVHQSLGRNLKSESAGHLLPSSCRISLSLSVSESSESVSESAGYLLPSSCRISDGRPASTHERALFDHFFDLF